MGRPSQSSVSLPRRVRRRSAPTAIAVTTVVAVLAVAVAMLSYKVASPHPSVSVGQLAALQKKVRTLSGRLATTQAAARAATRAANRTAAQRAAALGSCLTQVQREVDDLQAYLDFRAPPLQHRVTGACARLLHPRFDR